MARRQKDGFERFSITEYLLAPFRAVWSWGAGLDKDDKIRERETSSIVSLLLYPLRFLFSCILFLINSWAVTRHVRPFLLGVPALLVVTGVSGTAWLDYYRFPNKLQRTQQYYEKFLTDPEWGPKIAQHFALKHVVLKPEDLQAKFQLASVWEQLGEEQQALDLMSHLADKDLVLAHVWFARRVLADPGQLSPEEQNAQVERHLQKAMAIDPECGPAKIAWADYYLSRADLEAKDSPKYMEWVVKASEELLAVSESDSGEIVWQLPKLTKVLFEMGDLQRARAVFQNMRKILMQYIRKFPADERIPQIWVTLISASIQLKDYRTAAELIGEGRREADNAAVTALFENLEAQMLLQQVNDIKDQDSLENFEQALDLLGRGILKSPTNAIISDRLVGMIVPNESDGKDSSEQLEKARSMNAPAVPHLLLGIRKVLKGDALAGQTHWRIAETQSPNAQIILFSMIRSLIATFGDRIENPRDVIALAIELFPNQGLFYFLRGSDAMLRADYKQAVPDFEQAVEMVGSPANFEIRVQLAQCFKEMNETDKFDDQMRQLQAMVQRSDPRRQKVLEEYLRRLNE